MKEVIKIWGARVHNLKNIDVDILKGKLVDVVYQVEKKSVPSKLRTLGDKRDGQRLRLSKLLKIAMTVKGRTSTRGSTVILNMSIQEGVAGWFS